MRQNTNYLTANTPRMRAQAMSSATWSERESTMVLTLARRTQGRECEKEKEESGSRTPRPSSGVWQKRRRFDVYENETVIVKEGLRRKRFIRRHLFQDLPPEPRRSFATGHTVDLATGRFLLFFYPLHRMDLYSVSNATSTICHPHPSTDAVREIFRETCFTRGIFHRGYITFIIYIY